MYSSGQGTGKCTRLAKELASVLIWPRNWQVYSSGQGTGKCTYLAEEVMVNSTSQESGTCTHPAKELISVLIPTEFPVSIHKSQRIPEHDLTITLAFHYS